MAMQCPQIFALEPSHDSTDQQRLEKNPWTRKKSRLRSQKRSLAVRSPSISSVDDARPFNAMHNVIAVEKVKNLVEMKMESILPFLSFRVILVIIVCFSARTASAYVYPILPHFPSAYL